MGHLKMGLPMRPTEPGAGSDSSYTVVDGREVMPVFPRGTLGCGHAKRWSRVEQSLVRGTT